MRDRYEFTIDPQREPELYLLYCEAGLLDGARECIVKRYGPQHPLAGPLTVERDAAAMRLFEAVQKRDAGGLPPGVISLAMFRVKKGKPEKF